MSTRTAKPSYKLKFTNIFGVFGYVMALLAWTWIALIAAIPLINSGRLNFMLPQAPATPPPPIFEPLAPSFGTLLFGIITTVAVTLLALYSIYAVPRTVGKTGAKITKSTTKSLLPLVTRHQPITEQKAHLLSARLAFALKIGFSLLPILLSFFIPPTESISNLIGLIVTGCLSGSAIANFSVQMIAAQLFRIPKTQLW